MLHKIFGKLGIWRNNTVGKVVALHRPKFQILVFEYPMVGVTLESGINLSIAWCGPNTKQVNKASKRYLIN